METAKGPSPTRKRNRGEFVGTVDYAFDEDAPSSHPLIRNDAACAIAWVHDGFDAIEIYVDPALTDRQEEICEQVNVVSAAHEDIDGLSREILEFGRGAGLSAGIYERPPDAMTANLIAVVFTVG